MEVGEHYFDIAAEFPENLAARAARRREGFSVGCHSHSAKLARTFRNRFEYGYALGADGQAVSGILHVATGVNAAGGIFEGRADFEVGIRRVRVAAGVERGLDQSVH